MVTRAEPVTLDDFRRDLESVIPSESRVVVAHSAIWGFANKLDLPSREVPGAAIDVLLDTIGGERTLVMPTYTFSFPRTKIFDLKRTKPSTGIIVETFLARPGVRRSTSPMNSYAAIGPDADALLACPCTTAWGHDSVMGWLADVNARFLALGIHSLLSCSYYHTVEEWERVPYRYFKQFAGTLYDDGREIGPCQEVMYVRPLGINPRFLGTPADERLEARGLKLHSERSDGVLLESMAMKDIIAVSREVVVENSYAMIVEQDREAVKAWVAAGNLKREMDAMPPEQRYNPL